MGVFEWNICLFVCCTGYVWVSLAVLATRNPKYDSFLFLTSFGNAKTQRGKKEAHKLQE